MRILVSGATRAVRELLEVHKDRLGVLKTPQNGNRFPSNNIPWAMDNSAFSNFSQRKFDLMVVNSWEWMRFNPPQWLAVPDVVGDHLATLEQFELQIMEWEFEFGRVEWPLAFIVQNACRYDNIPWDDCDAIFIGGDTKFKLGLDAADCIRAAKDRGKKVHMGRVNSMKRIRYAHSLGVDTVDGSGYSRFRSRLERDLGLIEELDSAQALFDLSA